MALLAGVSRALARRLVDEGTATFDERAVEGRTRVAGGWVLRVDLPVPFSLEAEPIPLEVVYEDERVAVVDKPAGLTVHPGSGLKSGTLAAAVMHRWPEIEGVGEPDRWGIVHRLDRDTSGVIAVAKTESSLRELRAVFREHRASRLYLALAEGGFDIPTGTVDAPIGRDPARPTRFKVMGSGRPARTHYERRAGWSGLTLLAVRLETGRTHQIRVHLASIGHPVDGDRVYGAERQSVEGRIWLHAYRLSFPLGGAEVVAEAPLPPELAASLRELGPPAVGEV